MNIPKIIKSSETDLERVKAVLTLGFSSDALLRWVFPDAFSFLKCFDVWMEEFSKIALLLLLGLSGFIARMLIHAVTLPIEFDASFSKALPLLREGKYISQSNEKAVSQILKAASLTYVSAALADILNLGRWIVILSRR